MSQTASLEKAIAVPLEMAMAVCREMDIAVRQETILVVSLVMEHIFLMMKITLGGKEVRMHMYMCLSAK